jgi:hypothetical protein
MDQRPAKWRRDDVDFYRLEQTQFNAQILDGVNTTLFGYGGCVPGPTIRVTRGRKVREPPGLLGTLAVALAVGTLR